MAGMKACPDCGREMIHGMLYVYGSRGTGALNWQSTEKHPQRSLNPFRRGALVNKSIHKLLISNSIFHDGADTQEDSWYCPDCGRIFASFKLDEKDVSK